jgi:hypothetical protein
VDSIAAIKEMMVRPGSQAIWAMTFARQFVPIRSGRNH